MNTNPVRYTDSTGHVSDTIVDIAFIVTTGRYSFSAATPVATPDGVVLISAIEVGDTVLAYHMAW